MLKRYIPQGLKLGATDYPFSEALPMIFGKRRTNRGFEGLALSHDQKTLYLVLQSPLANPQRKTGNRSRNTRVLVFDIPSETVVAEYAYRFEFAKDFDAARKLRPNQMKLSAVAYVNRRTLLILERTNTVAKIYSVDLSKATNILGSKWDDPKTSPSFEALAENELGGLKALPKTLVLDLSRFKGLPEKLEGLAILDRNTIAVTNDNDFDMPRRRFDGAGNSIGPRTNSQIIVISLSQPLPGPP